MSGTAKRLILALLASVLVAGIVVAFFDGDTDAPVDTPPVTSSEVAATTTPATSTSRPPSTEAPLVVPARALPSGDRAADAGCEQPIVVRPPAADLASQVSAAPPGTCFVFEPGEYRFSEVVPKDYMSFVGESSESVVVRGDGQTENAFHGTAHSVTIARMTFTQFLGDGGEKRQEQAPIRGTAAIWASDRGEMATDWLIEGVASTDNFASGLLIGDDFTVRGSRFEGNGVTGISGSEVVGGLIEHNLIAGNGDEQATGFEVNGGGMKFGETGQDDAPLVIRENEVAGNTGIGVWCDIGCRGFQVIDNYIHDHDSRAVMYELSVNAEIRGNTIIDSNSWADFSRDFNAGAITIGESARVLVEDNYIEGSVSAITVRQTLRPVRPGEDFLDNYDFINVAVADVIVRANVIVDAEASGVSIGRTGGGLISDPTSIVFEGNTYEDPESMTFWWEDGTSGSFLEWQGSGRDLEPLGTAVPNRRSWSSVDTATVVPDRPAAPPLPLFINAGGDQHEASDGTIWLSDRYFVGGSTAVHDVGDVVGTEDDPLFVNERWGMQGYSIPVEAGSYIVRLLHAEVFEGCQIIGCRQFSVSIEGETVVDSLDIFAAVGGRAPFEHEHVVTVDDGSLDIEFDRTLQDPQVSAIVIDRADAD